MKITAVKINKAQNQERKLKAYATVTFDDQFVVHGIKVIEGDDKTFIAMPSRKNASDEFVDVAHPINAEFRAELENAIFEEYSNC